MWWNNGKLLNDIKSANYNDKYKQEKLFLGIANTMPEGFDTLSVQKDSSYETKHVRGILELNTFLNIKKPLSFKGKYYPEDDHGTVPLITEYNALRFIFDFYNLKLKEADFNISQDDFVKTIENHYKNLSVEFGMEMNPEENFCNELGYHCMNIKQSKKAEYLFKLNVKNYPLSFNAFDSLGDLYLDIGEKEKAVENYKKSVSLNSESVSKAKLLELR